MRRTDQSSIGHRRAPTNDSLNTINNLENHNDNLIMEEREDSDAPLPVRSSSGVSFLVLFCFESFGDPVE